VHLLDAVDGHVARPRDHDPPPVEGLAAGLEHLVGEEGRAVAGRLGAHQRAAPAQALAGEHPGLVAVGDPLVLAEQVADLAAADADVAGRHVGVLPQVAVELGHERLAEPHDLGVGAALGVEVGAALAAADRHPGEGVLEDLLEAEEFDDAQVHRGVEPQAALVGAQRGVEFDPEAAVDVHLAAVVLPRHAEDDLPLGLADALDGLHLGVLGVPRQHDREGLEHLADGLVELDLTRVPAEDLVVDPLHDRRHVCVHCSPILALPASTGPFGGPYEPSGTRSSSGVRDRGACDRPRRPPAPSPGTGRSWTHVPAPA
jgi:hypothetical protein